MRSSKLLTLVLAMTAACGLWATGCGDDSTPGTRLVTIQLDPPSAALQVGVTQDFTATGVYSDGSTQDLTATATWASSDEAVATVDAGTVTAVAAGTTEITATFEEITGTATVTVSEAEVTQVIVTPPNATIGIGDTADFTARAVYDDGTDADVTDTATWNSSDDAIATVVDGTVTGVAGGTVTVTAEFGGETSNAATVVVNPDLELESIQITPATATIGIGATQQYLALGTYTDGSSRDLSGDVTWDSSDTGIATIDADGLAEGVAAGETTITAELDGITSNDATLTVSEAELVAITLSPVSGTLYAGSTDTLALTATGSYDDGSTGDLTDVATWASSDDTIATVSNAAGTEGVVSPSASNDGVVQITATFGGVTSSPAVITVLPSTVVTGVVVEPATATIVDGATQAFTATATYEDGRSADVTATATWASSDTGIATVSTAGVATGAAPGTADITATYGGETGTAALTVTAATIVSIAVTPAVATIPAGTTQDFVAVATLTDGSTSDITASATWSSSATAVATMTGATATGVAAGTATITATQGTASGTATLVVTAATLTSIAVTPPTSTIPVLGSVTLTATGTYSDGSTNPITTTVGWTTSNAAVATVAGGVVSGVSTGGPVTITATSGTITGTATVTVSGGILTSITVTPATPAALPVGRTQAFIATGNYSDGSTSPLTTDANLTWTSSNVAAATISNAAGTKGTASAVAAGATNITARYVAGTVDVTSAPVILNVTAAVLETITVAPATATIPAGFTVALTATGRYSDGSNVDITNSCSWTSSSTTTATVSTTGATGRGVVTGVAAGPATITATLGTITGTSAVTVSTATLTRVDVSPATASINVAGTQTFTAQGTFSDTSTRDITQDVDWTSSAVAVATMSAPPALKGIATGVSAGTSTITARHVSGVQDTAVLTVTNSTVTSVEVHYYAPGTADPCTAAASDNYLTGLVIGVNVQARAIARFADGRCAEVTSAATWSPASGTILTVSNAAGSQGLVAPAGQGTASIVATYNAVPSAPLVATVYNCVVGGVTVTPVNPTIYLGQTQNFAAAAVYGVATTGNCTAVPATLQPHFITSQVTWSSSNTAVATVAPATGVASAVTAGTTTIQARWNPTVAGSTTLTVATACVTSIDLLPGDVTMPYVSGWGAQAIQPLSVVVRYSDGTSPTITNPAHVTWSGAAVAPTTGRFAVAGWNVSPTGATTAAQALTATLVTTGSPAPYTLCATGTGTDSINLQATATTLTGLALTPADRTVSRGQLVTYTATGTFADTSSFDVTLAVNASGTWTSSLPAVATVANNVATAVADGTTVIRAALSGVTGLTGLTVSGRVVEAVRVTIQGTGATTFPVGVPLWFLVEADYSDTPGFVPATSAVTSWTITPSTAAEVRSTYPLQGNNQLVVTTGAAATMYVDACVGTVCAGTANRAGPYTIQAVALEYVQVRGTPIAPQFVETGFDGITPPVNYRYDMWRSVIAQMSVTAHFTTLGDYDVTRIATWASDTPATVAMVTTAGQEGRIQSFAATGAARITATHGGRSNYGTVTVISSGTCYQAIRILPASQTVAAGLTVLYTTERQDNTGTWNTFSPGANWRSDSTAIAQYTGTPGQFRGIAAGSTTVRVDHTPAEICSGVASPLTASAGIVVSAHTIAALDIQCQDPTGAALVGIPVNVWATCDVYARYSDEVTFTYDAAHEVTDQALWSIAPSTIADVTDQDIAEIVGRAAGTGTIGASVGAISDTYALTVNTATLTSVTVTPNTVRSPVGPAGARFARDFQAFANFSGGAIYEVTDRAATTWSTTTATLCSVDNVAPNKGAGSAIAAGACNVRAVWGTQTGNATWTLHAATPEDVCHLTPATANVPRATTLQMAADLCWTTAGDCTNMPSCDRPATTLVTWTTDNSAVATINAAGLITAGPTAATTGMHAAYTGATTANGTINVTARCVNGMTVSLSTTEAAPGVPVLATATVTYSTGAPATAVATWTSSNNAVIQPASDGFSGAYYNFVAQATAGTANLVATYAGADPLCSGTTLTASAPITVYAGTVESITISPNPISAAVAQRVTITARGNYTGGRSFDITPVANWTTGNASIAVVGTEPGATPPRRFLEAVATGTTVLNADFRGVYASAPVTVSGGLVDRIWVLGTNTNAPAGGCSELPCGRLVIDNGGSGAAPAYGWRSTAPTAACIDTTWRHPVSTATITYTTRVTATLHYTDNHYETSAAAVGWTSSTPAVATVSADGLVTIGTTAGTTTITATYTPPGGGTAITDTLVFTSVAGALGTVRINGGAATVSFPDGTQSDLYGEGQFGTTWYCIEPTVSWSTASATVASVVASSGLATGESVGTTTITAALGGVTDDVGVSVTAAALSYVEVLPGTLTVENGELFQLQAIGHYSDGSTADLTAAPTTACSTRTWVAEDAAGATITTPIQAVGTTGQFQANSTATGAARAEFCCGLVCAGGTTDRRATVTVTAP